MDHRFLALHEMLAVSSTRVPPSKVPVYAVVMATAFLLTVSGMPLEARLAGHA